MFLERTCTQSITSGVEFVKKYVKASTHFKVTQKRDYIEEKVWKDTRFMFNKPMLDKFDKHKTGFWV